MCAKANPKKSDKTPDTPETPKARRREGGGGFPAPGSKTAETETNGETGTPDAPTNPETNPEETQTPSTSTDTSIEEKAGAVQPLDDGHLSFPIPHDAVRTSQYRTRHVDIGALTPNQQNGLNRLFHGLARENEHLENERRVERPTDAVRWLLERINATAIGADVAESGD